ncbi:MAG: serine hydrolase [Pseudobacter sp.]|uniref:serine hydrolase n=1 Tax=Pseudobacter sp. TaxID=2045420 RepID=UPI003F7E1700
MVRNSTLFIFILLIMTSACNNIDTPALLKEQILTELSSHPGQYAVAFKDLASGEEVLINEKAVFHAASTMKTPVMIEVLKQAGQGRFLLTDSFIVKNEFKSIVDSSSYQLDSTEDSDKDIYKQLGQSVPLDQLVRNMIIKSSNLSTNMVIELVGASNVNNTMRELGAKDILVLRGVEDSKAFDKGLNNTTTARDLMIIFEKIAKDQVVSKQACQLMRGILLDQHFNAILPAKLPKDVQVAHKTGNITGVEHDGGIVYMKNGKSYVLVLLSKGFQDEAGNKEMLAGISKMVYDYESRK